LEYCVIQYADTALNTASAYNIYINHCNISYNNKALLIQNSKVTFENDLIYKNQRVFPSIYVSSSDAFFENCKIFNNLIYQSYSCDNLVLVNCIFANNQQLDFGTSDFKVLNSTFVNNPTTRFGSSNPDIYNSIFYSSSDISLYGINCNPKYYNCLFKLGLNHTGNNIYAAAPVFYKITDGVGTGYDALAADFRIRSISPAINAGTTNVIGLNIPVTDIAGNLRINDDSIDIGAYENQGKKLEFLTQPLGGIICAGDTISFTVSVTDTANYQWQKDGVNLTGATSAGHTIFSINENEEGNYICYASNAYGKISSTPAFVKVNIAPEITDQSSGALVAKGAPISLEVRADGSRPLRHQWQKDSIDLLSDTTFKLKIDSFKPENEGSYICKIFNSCGSINTTPALLSLAPSICMVTVSQPKVGDNGHNLIVWNKESKIAYSRFNIYRESSVEGYYDSIGSVSYTKIGVFEDTLVNPKDQAYLYKITAVNSSNVETDINSSLLHKTIHLITTKGEQGGIQLEWDQYIGFQYSTYYIYRSSNGKDFLPVDSIASSTRAWTDNTVVGPNDTLYYYISVKNPAGTCYPNGHAKAGSDLYSQSISNMEDNRIRGTEITKSETDNLNFSCHPNPFCDYTIISYTLQKASDVTLEAYNMLGEKVLTFVNARQTAGNYNYRFCSKEKGFSIGMYIIKMKAGNSIIVQKLTDIK